MKTVQLHRLLTISMAFLLSFLLKPALAQEKVITKENQQWLQYYNSLTLSDKVKIKSDVGYRWRDNFDEGSTFLARTSLAHNIGSNAWASMGVGYFESLKDGEETQWEFRLYQEATLKTPLNHFSLSHRWRIEERWFNKSTTSEFDSYSFRFRYNIGVHIPLFTISSKNPDQKLTLSVSDEIMFNAGKDIVNNVFDKNRILIGPSIPVTPSIDLSVIYNYEFASQSEAAHYKNTNIIWVQIKHDINLTK